jgi:hypothetical protein
MERNLNCELINAEHSDYKMYAGHKRSRTPNILELSSDTFLQVGLMQYS